MGTTCRQLITNTILWFSKEVFVFNQPQSGRISHRFITVNKTWIGIPNKIRDKGANLDLLTYKIHWNNFLWCMRYNAHWLHKLSQIDLNKKWPHLARKKLLFHQEIARVHTFCYQDRFGLQISSLPQYSMDAALSGYFLFLSLKKLLREEREKERLIFAHN